MNKNITIIALLGAIAIILGAFGAHALKEVLTADAFKSFETGVRYQMYHVILLFFVNTYQGLSEKQKNTISYLFFIGILCFSGSIYIIQLTPISAKSIWFVTPLGGLLLIAGWLYLFKIFLKKSVKQ